MALGPGARLGPYQVAAKLGEGGMGEVWRARDLRLGREVAVKLLPDRLSGQEVNLARFEQEARAASSLNHPNIVTVHDVGTYEGRPYLVMELVQGRTLRQLITRGRPLGLRRALEIAGQAADAMAVAHAAGIVHRDLKPENLMVTAEGRLKILDFGLAKLTGTEAEPGLSRRELASTLGAEESPVELSRRPQSQPGTLLGTLGFMSPEQVRGKPIDFRADQFAFGAILYEMVTGQPAFERPARIETLAAILDQEPTSVAELNPAVPPPLRWTIERCLAKRPAERYASTLDLARELRTIGQHLDETPSSGSSPTAARLSAALPGRGRRLAVAAAAGVLIAAIAGALWLARRGPALPDSKQLAVLAFRGTQGDAAERAFSDGLVETLTTRLTQLERFQGAFWVVPASEVRRARVESVEAARRTFGATLVITGSVQQVGEQVRLTANLVEAATLRQLRALSFDRPLTDVAALQDDLVRRVGEMLDLEVGDEAGRVLDAGRTQVADAYGAYLRGRGHLLDYQDPANVEAAISHFQAALQRDPDYALAYAGLGEAYWRQYGLTRDAAVVDLARRACSRAVELNDLLAPVHVTLGLLARGTGDPAAALTSFQTALRLDPASAVARRELGNTLAVLGRRDEAERTFRAAIEARPGDWASYNDLGVFYHRGGRYTEAAEQFRRVIEIAPDNVRGYSNLGGIYQLLGRHLEARDVLEQAVRLQPTASVLSNLATVQFYLGEYGAAARTFERALELSGGSDYRLWQNLAGAYHWAPGERARAPAAYQRAIEVGEQSLGVNPRDAILLADLAECEAMRGRPERAAERLIAALALAPEDPDVQFRAAFVAEQAGDRAQALTNLRAALDAGYSRHEVELHPGFAALRQDPRFHEIWAASPATAAH